MGWKVLSPDPRGHLIEIPEDQAQPLRSYPTEDELFDRKQREDGLRPRVNADAPPQAPTRPPEAVKALLDVIEAAKWNGCCFHYWILRHEKMMRQIFADIPNPTSDQIKYFDELFDSFSQPPNMMKEDI